MNIEDILKNKDKTRIFIAGPMRGYPNSNYDKFDEMEKRLIGLGFDVVNPVQIIKQFEGDEKKAEELSQKEQKTCNTILLLNGWQWSKGSAVEVKTASEFGMQFLFESDILELTKGEK